jgi:hypothetical protein
VNEWNIAALILERWGLPGLIGCGLIWAMYRFGVTPMPTSPPREVPNEMAVAIAKLAEKMDAHHANAQGQREEVMEFLHGLDKRLAVMEAVAKRPGQ